jgi:7,8-dihydropterin-6-yl-methyl-4-(beta-D-ribofuranosyl)aminobenzene 5'-phosphate synthase
VLSHGHSDHTTGLDGLIRALGRTSLPVLIHPEFWSRRRITLPGRDPVELATTSRRALEGAGFVVVEDRQPSFLFEGAVLVTGEVDRTTEFERGLATHQAWRQGRWRPDRLILDDQALVLSVKDKGLVVLTGCGHAGVVNTVGYACRLTQPERVYAVIGGFHLSGPHFEPQHPGGLRRPGRHRATGAGARPLHRLAGRPYPGRALPGRLYPDQCRHQLRAVGAL